MNDEDNTALKLVARVLDGFFAENMGAAGLIDPAYAFMWQELERQVKAGGKRLRPHMVLLSYRAFGGSDFTAIAPVAAATELLHLSMLIHDDIIDRDTVRRGVPNMIGAYLETYAPLLSDVHERQHFAESSALLAGDILLSGAYQLINSADIDPGIKQQVQVRLSRSIFEIAGGELIDTEASFRPAGKADPLVVARYKTAGYSFVAPLQMGALLAGVSEAQLDALHRFGENLGIAYQLHDDILGIFGDSETTGKSVTSDIEEGKHTYMAAYFLAHADDAARRKFTAVYGSKKVSAEDAATIRTLFMNSGARRATEEAISRYESAAADTIETLGLVQGYEEQFRQLISRSLKRNA